MTKDPFVSIIIPVWGTEKVFAKTLDSIANQRFADWECVCVDDGTPDRCGEIADQYAAKDPRFVVIHKKNEGCTAARRDGYLKAKGQYIILLDCDDMLGEGFLEAAASAIARDPELDAVIGRTVLIDEDGSILPPERQLQDTWSGVLEMPKDVQKLVQSPDRWSLLATFGRLLRRSILVDGQMFETAPKVYAADSCLMARFLDAARKVAVLPPEITGCYYRQISTSGSRTHRCEYRDSIVAMLEYFQEYGKTSVIRQIAAQSALGWLNSIKTAPAGNRGRYLNDLLSQPKFKSVFLRSIVEGASLKYRIVATVLMFLPKPLLAYVLKRVLGVAS